VDGPRPRPGDLDPHGRRCRGVHALPARRRCRIIYFVFDRWGDPDKTGTWGWHPFGGEVLGYRTFGGLTIPAAGRLGWFFDTDRWPATASFHYRITQLHLLTEPGQLTNRM
jgi:hypothetical protein